MDRNYHNDVIKWNTLLSLPKNIDTVLTVSILVKRTQNALLIVSHEKPTALSYIISIKKLLKMCYHHELTLFHT